MRQPGIEGDAPSLHVEFVDDDQAAFKSEGDALDESTPGLSEVLIHTAKVTQLVRLSREQYVQEQTADQLSLSVSRAVVRRSDAAFLAEEAPTPPAVAPVAGLLNVENVIDGDPVANNPQGRARRVAPFRRRLGVNDTVTHEEELAARRDQSR